MNPILIPVDGSTPSLKALETAIAFNTLDQQSEMMLLAVVPPLIGRSRGVFTSEELNLFYQAEAEFMLNAAKSMLDKAGLPYRERTVVGMPAETISAVATQINAKKIYLGTRGRGASTSLLLGSVAAKVVSLTQLPVTLVNAKE